MNCPRGGWSEDDEYDLSDGKNPVDERGGAIDQYGGYHPPGSSMALAYRLAKTPRVLNKHAVGIPPGAIYVGRGSKWGNPFRIGVAGDRAKVIAKYEFWLREQPELMAQLSELRGHDLVCFCAPAPCHGDLLLRLANEELK